MDDEEVGMGFGGWGVTRGQVCLAHRGMDINTKMGLLVMHPGGVGCLDDKRVVGAGFGLCPHSK